MEWEWEGDGQVRIRSEREAELARALAAQRAATLNAVFAILKQRMETVEGKDWTADSEVAWIAALVAELQLECQVRGVEGARD